jgi:hypothetical protein
MLDFKKNIQVLVHIIMGHDAYQSSFFSKAASVSTDHLLISPCRFPIAVEVAVDVIGRCRGYCSHFIIPTLRNFSCYL